jgi:hypothetical protein
MSKMGDVGITRSHQYTGRGALHSVRGRSIVGLYSLTRMVTSRSCDMHRCPSNNVRTYIACVLSGASDVAGHLCFLEEKGT